MNETTMTLNGNLVEAPSLRRTRNGHLVANFRVAATSRRFDRDKGEWADSGTLFVTCTAWRAMAENVHASLTKGQPVIVTGRYYQRDFRVNETLRTAYELEVTAVGHDLSRGISRFERTPRSPMSTPVDVDPDGTPTDHTAHYLDLDNDFTNPGEPMGGLDPRELTDQSISGEIDLATGEVREYDSGDGITAGAESGDFAKV